MTQSNQAKNRTDLVHLRSATHSMLKKRRHYVDPIHGEIWALTRAERDVILHSFTETNALRKRLRRLESNRD